MLLPIEYWKNTLSKLGVRVERRPVKRKSRDLRFGFETLEPRKVMSGNAPPIIGEFLASPVTVNLGSQITLTATGVTDPDDDAISELRFFRDVDNDGLLTEADGAPLGIDTDGGDGWFITASTAGFSGGTQAFFVVATDSHGLDSEPVAATSTLLLAPKIIDNGGSGYSVVSANYWSTSGGGYGGGHQFEFGATNGYAEWTFDDLPTGEYRVSATWVQGTNRGTNVPYNVFDGSLDVGEVRVNQRIIPDPDVVAGSRNFEHLGSFSVVNGALVVRMTNNSGDGRAIADAVRIEHIGPAQQVSDIRVFDGGTELTDGVSTVNLGTTFYGTPTAAKTLSVKNAGLTDLVLDELTQEDMPAGVILVASYGSTTLARGESTTFRIAMAATSTGPFSGILSLPSDDPDEPAFAITLSGVVNASKIIDNGTAVPGFTVDSTNYWSTSGGGYGGGHQFEFGATGGYATWTFDDLPAGEYRVSATWFEGTNRGTNVPYTIFDGSFGVGAVAINQRNAPASDVIAGSKKFEHLGAFSIINGSLVVRMTNSSGDGRAIADAIRIEHLGSVQLTPDIRVFADGTTELTDGASTVNLGTTFFGTPAATKTFTVENAGLTELVLDELTQADMPAGVTLVSTYASATLARGESTTFQVKLAATSTGPLSGILSLPSNDADEPAFAITLAGVVNASKVIDNGDVGYTTVSTNYWSTTAGYQFEFGATGGHAEWAFENLPEGEYRIWATWPKNANWSSVAPYTVSDGSSALSTIKVNQQLAPTADHVAGGQTFEELGLFGITSGSAVVRLTHVGPKGVAADAIRIEYVGKLPEVRFTDTGSELLVDGSPASVVSFGESERSRKAVEVIAVTNSSSSALTLTQVTQEDLPAGYLLLGGFGTLTLDPGESAHARIRLDAILPGTYGGTIAIEAGTETFDLVITGEVISGPLVVDNSDPDFATTGSGWQNGSSGTGFGDAHLKASGASAGRTATWTVEGLAEGAYLVYATFMPSAGNTDEAPYNLYDGAALEQQVTVNQRQLPSIAENVSGQGFGYVGQINVNSGTLVVELDASNLSGGWAIADAIYVVPRTLGEFYGFAAPGQMVTGSEEFITTGIVDPDGELVDTISVYKDTNDNGVFDPEVDELLHADTTPGDGMSFGLSGFANGLFGLFVVATKNGTVVTTKSTTVTTSNWWTVSIGGAQPGEALFSSTGGLFASPFPIELAPGQTLDNAWQGAVQSRVFGLVITKNDWEGGQLYYHAFPGAAYALGTASELKNLYGEIHRSLFETVGSAVTADTKLIALEDLTGASDNDSDYDDMFWEVTLTPATVVVETKDSDEPGSCSCACSCSLVGITGGGNSSAFLPLARGVDAVANVSTTPRTIVRVVTNLPNEFATAPDSVEMKLTFGGIDQGTVYYTGADFFPGDEVVFAKEVDATGRYDWEMTVLYTYDSQIVPYVFTGKQDLISRADSPVGRGFSIAELDRLDIQPSGANLITGDNHAIWHTKTGSSTFTGEAGDLTFSTLVQNGDNTYTLTSASGMESHFDANGLLTSRVDPTGNTRSYAYNTDGTISTITDHTGAVVTFHYSSGLLSSVVDSDGAVTTLAHNAAGELLSVTQPDPDGAGPLESPITTYGYDLVTGLLTTIVDPRGEVTAMEYDHSGQLSKIVQPCGGESTYTMYRSLGVIDLAVHGSSASNPAPLVPSGSYEVQRDELGTETHLRRDRFGNVIWQRDALGNVTSFERNADGLITTITQPDPDGVGPLGPLVTQFEYDAQGNVTKIIHPDLTEESWTYDATFSRPTSHTDQLGRVTLWQIDSSNGLVVSVTEVVGQIDSLLNSETDDVTTSFAYTTGGGVPAGLVETVTDPLGTVTSMTYTARGLLASMTQAVGTPDETTTTFEYDASDNLTAVIDGIGRRTEYAYDNLNRLISLTQGATPGPGPQQHYWQFTYDAAGNRTHVTDPMGNVTEYVYDERGRLSEVIQADPDGAGPLDAPVTTYDFDCVNNLVGLADALGRETTYEYDALRRMVRAISPDPDGAGPAEAPTVEMAYNTVGWLTSQTDPSGNVTAYTYDAMGRVILLTQPDPDGAGPLAAPVTSFTYDAAGQLLTVTDPLGRVTSYSYDDLGRVITVTRPDPDGAGPLTAPVTTYAYDKVGNVTSVTDPLGNVTEYVYDSLYRLTQIVEADPDGAGPLTSPVTTYTFDAASQLVSVTDPLGRTTTFEYDGLGRLTKRTEPDPDGAGPELAAFMVYTYNAVGNVISESNRLGHTTAYAYDNLYRATKVTDANGKDTLFAYDIVGNRLSLTDSVGNTTQWVYDGLDRVVQEENELGNSRYFVYDVASNLIQRTDRNGRVTQFTYDNLQRQTAEIWKDGDTVVKEFTFVFDVASQLVGIGDGTADYTYEYDFLGRVTQSQFVFAALPQPVTLGQTFDAGSRRTSLFAAIGGTADFKNEFAYDNLNRLAVLTQQGQTDGNAVAEKRIEFARLADGRLDEIRRYADLAGTQFVANTGFGYDGAGRLTAMTHAKDTSVFAGYGWTYDVANRMTSFTNSVYTSEDAIYTHDALGQLLGATRNDPSDDEAYVYDENGNRITANGDAYTTGTNNRILSDGTNTYDYDAEGNITRITNIATGDYRDLEWDHRNRLVKVTQFDDTDAEQWRVEYIYDVYNRLVGRTEFLNASATPAPEDIFIYDGYQMILKLDGSGNVQSRTLWGDRVDQLLANEDAAGNVTWPLTDHLNTVRDIVSYDSGTDTTTLENHIVYDSFGNVVSETNPSVASDFLFTARYTDATTGLQWNLNRWYIPSIGRWASEDPIGFAAGDPNLARYVGNQPFGRIDPYGLQEIGEPEYFTGRRELQRIYRRYAELYSRNPDKYLWAGLAAHAGSVVVVQMYDRIECDKNTIKSLLAQSPSLRAYPTFTDMQVAMFKLKQMIVIQRLIVKMAQDIEADIGKQFEAYDASGLAGIEALIAGGMSREILVPWQEIDAGDVVGGTEGLTQREQVQVLKDGYDKINTLGSGTLIAMRMSWEASSGLDGCPTFSEASHGWWTDTSGPDTNARWHYVRDIVLTRWSSMARGERDAAVRKALEAVNSAPVQPRWR